MSSRFALAKVASAAAAGGVGSLAAQALLAIALLGLFDPVAAGTYSLASQIAFAWATLALAQSSVSVLSSQTTSVSFQAQMAWRSSFKRWLWMAPAAWAIVAWSDRGVASQSQGALALMVWISATSLAQMGWMLAQSSTLRLQSTASVFAVRALPPTIAALVTSLGAFSAPQLGGTILLGAALSGYAVGALWLRPVWRAQENTPHPLHTSHPPADERSDGLKLAHSASDVLTAAALAVHWTSLYGVAQAGGLLILLRVLGFVPALAGSAWAQVVMDRKELARSLTGAVAAVGSVLVACLAFGVNSALQQGGLSAAWQLLQPYLLPVALWQSASCVMAASWHLPIQHRRAASFSQQCLIINTGQMLWLFLPPLLGWSLSDHLWGLCIWMAASLTIQAAWALRLGR